MSENWQVEHPSLKEYHDGWKNLPLPYDDESIIYNPLIFDLCDRKYIHPTGHAKRMPDMKSLVQDERSALFDFCRNVMIASSCGIHQLKMSSDTLGILPKLCCSYAADWDLAATCILARTCVYLGLSSEPPFNSAILWLLDQQRSNGAFGLLLPTEHQNSQEMECIERDLLATIDILWTLAEIHRPGFMLAALSR